MMTTMVTDDVTIGHAPVAYCGSSSSSSSAAEADCATSRQSQLAELTDGTHLKYGPSGESNLSEEGAFVCCGDDRRDAFSTRADVDDGLINVNRISSRVVRSADGYATQTMAVEDDDDDDAITTAAILGPTMSANMTMPPHRPTTRSGYRHTRQPNIMTPSSSSLAISFLLITTTLLLLLNPSTIIVVTAQLSSCSCSPLRYEFKLDLTASCPPLPPPFPPNSVFGSGVKDYTCTIGQEPLPSAPQQITSEDATLKEAEMDVSSEESADGGSVRGRTLRRRSLTSAFDYFPELRQSASSSSSSSYSKASDYFPELTQQQLDQTIEELEWSSANFSASSLTSETTTETGGGIDSVPVSIYSIQFLEVDTKFNVINQDSAYVRGIDFTNGDTFNYTSISAEMPEVTPGGMNMVLRGVNAAGEPIRNVFTITFTNDCDVETFRVGEAIGWVVFENLEPASSQTCDAIVTNPPTPSPTRSPLTAPSTPYPTKTPSEETTEEPTPSPTTRPTDGFPVTTPYPTKTPSEETTEEPTPSPTTRPTDGFPVTTPTPTGKPSSTKEPSQWNHPHWNSTPSHPGYHGKSTKSSKSSSKSSKSSSSKSSKKSSSHGWGHSKEDGSTSKWHGSGWARRKRENYSRGEPVRDLQRQQHHRRRAQEEAEKKERGIKEDDRRRSLRRGDHDVEGKGLDTAFFTDAVAVFDKMRLDKAQRVDLEERKRHQRRLKR